MNEEFRDKVVLLTGGGGNIARTTALDFARAGAKLVLCDLNVQKADAVGREIRELGGEASAIAVDVTQYREAAAVVDAVIQKYGKIDILITAAGGSTREKMCYFVDQDISVIENNIDINLYGQLYFAHAAVPYMVERRQGRIIFVTSVVGIQGNRGYAEYSAAKGGVTVLAKSLAMELGEFDITVNCVSPAFVDRNNRDTSNVQFIRRSETPEDISNVITFLASSKSGFITGQNYVVDGGWGLGVQSNTAPARYQFEKYNREKYFNH